MKLVTKPFIGAAQSSGDAPLRFSGFPEDFVGAAAQSGYDSARTPSAGCERFSVQSKSSNNFNSRFCLSADAVQKLPDITYKNAASHCMSSVLIDTRRKLSKKQVSARPGRGAQI